MGRSNPLPSTNHVNGQERCHSLLSTIACCECYLQISENGTLTYYPLTTNIFLFFYCVHERCDVNVIDNNCNRTVYYVTFVSYKRNMKNQSRDL